jgi:hypothetical protein
LPIVASPDAVRAPARPSTFVDAFAVALPDVISGCGLRSRIDWVAFPGGGR